MNPAKLHLILNHLPITFIIIGIMVLVIGILLKSKITKNIAYGINILATIFGFVTLYTGELAKQFIKEISSVDIRIVTNHESVALAFLIFVYIIGLLSVLALWLNLKKSKFLKYIDILIVLLLGFVIYFAVEAGVSGGLIRHPEIMETTTH